MLYTDSVMTVPKGAIAGGKDKAYVYLKLGKSKRDENSKEKHNVLMIGKYVDGGEGFYPNDNYFEFYKMDKPLGNAKGVGRPRKNREISYHELKDGAKTSFGYAIACHHVAREIGLWDILENTFGERFARKALALASFFTYDNNRGATCLELFAKDHMLFTDTIMNSQRASELYTSITDDELQVFFRDWISLNMRKDTDQIFYDVTSISSYSECITEVAWGYNRDHEKLAQDNLGLFVSRNTKLPLFYCNYNGGINDFTNFPYILAKASEIGIDNRFTIVFDGCFSEGNTVDFTAYKNNKIIVGAPVEHCANVKNEILKWRSSLKIAADMLDPLVEENYSSYEVPFTIGTTAGRLIMYRNGSKAAKELETMRINLTKEKFNVNKNDGFTKTRPSRSCLKFFNATPVRENISSDKGKAKSKSKAKIVGYKLSLSEEKVQNEYMLCGSVALFTTDFNVDHKECLYSYRLKDMCEKAFANIKNDMLGERMYVHSSEAWHGKLFITFLGLIIRIYIQNKLRDWIREKRLSLDFCLEVLSKIKCHKYRERWILDNAFCKESKEIIKILHLPINSLSESIKQ